MNPAPEHGDTIAEAMSTPEVPTKPRVMTRQEMGKLRRQYLTVVNPIVAACEHQMKIGHPPHRNCDYCWEAYFKAVANVKEIHDELIEKGIRAFTAKRGTKFVQAFSRFITNEMYKYENEMVEKAAAEVPITMEAAINGQ
jgi:hypothetical protein